MSQPNNLTIPYPQEFLEIWDGCGHLDCLPDCRIGLENGYCARIEKAFAEFNAAAPASCVPLRPRARHSNLWHVQNDE